MLVKEEAMLVVARQASRSTDANESVKITTSRVVVSSEMVLASPLVTRPKGGQSRVPKVIRFFPPGVYGYQRTPDTEQCLFIPTNTDMQKSQIRLSKHSFTVRTGMRVNKTTMQVSLVRQGTSRSVNDL